MPAKSRTSISATASPLLRHRAGDLRGILNGVDTGIWNPATDPALAAGYAANRLAAKRANKTALQAKWDWKSHPTARCSGSSAA
jgi:starch synthase